MPWQWSDQYDLKLQIAGHAFDIDRVLLRGDPAAARFAVFHLNGDQVQCVEALNSPQDFIFGKHLIASRKSVDLGKLGDPAIALTEIAAQLPNSTKLKFGDHGRCLRTPTSGE